MDNKLLKYKDSKFGLFLIRRKKYAPLLFFIAGFTWDSLTLGRIDRLYDNVILCTYMTLLTISIYFYNLVDSEKWKNKFIQLYGKYLPLAVQFFLGGLSSAYVIYFSRSVSISKTASFFLILIFLLIANELFKKRISNRYLQFCAYFFVNFTFLSFFVPVILKEMNTNIFIISGILSLASTLLLIVLVYRSSASTRIEIVKWKMLGMILAIYILINTFYYFRLIPPVPLALDKGLVAHSIAKKNGKYIVTYEVDDWYIFWRDHKVDFYRKSNQKVYVFTSIFAPTDLKKKIYHVWKWYNPKTEKWKTLDKIGFEIVGGRDSGYRGYSYKSNLINGEWKVDVITEEGLVLGVVDFNININKPNLKPHIITREF
ncbi:DUF2914 domain-containing protein [Polaribacter cellanae]|uniref:DUF2914 domain-containing protein n=1 Tax=Polaribacter cellanae TaxID=2818493 RepID=A0A975H7U7_9FLAO|nr:DUF2914 domain-containing protein [Polaribacter cellanae]QTE23837.1 DUF2914 domain-containing protein [Polaribacter cellanae]